MCFCKHLKLADFLGWEINTSIQFGKKLDEANPSVAVLLSVFSVIAHFKSGVPEYAWSDFSNLVQAEWFSLLYTQFSLTETETAVKPWKKYTLAKTH